MKKITVCLIILICIALITSNVSAVTPVTTQHVPGGPYTGYYQVFCNVDGAKVDLINNISGVRYSGIIENGSTKIYASVSVTPNQWIEEISVSADGYITQTIHNLPSYPSGTVNYTVTLEHDPNAVPTGTYDGELCIYCNVDGASVNYEYYKPASSKVFNNTIFVSKGKAVINIAGSVQSIISINVSAEGYQPQYNVNFTHPRGGKSTSVTVKLEPLSPKSPMPIISLFGGLCTVTYITLIKKEEL